MLKKKIDKVKMYFITAVILLVVFVAGGSYNLREQRFLSVDGFLGEIYYWKYKLSYIWGGERNVRGTARAVPVLVYHGILNRPDGSQINLLAGDFKAQMFALKYAGYRTVTAEELYRFMRGEISLPARSFMLTFDDGRKDSYRRADPILRALGFKATMFAITKYSLDRGSNYYLSKDELLRMDRSGRWDIEVHTDAGHDMLKDAVGEGRFFGDKIWRDGRTRIETDAEFVGRINGDFARAKEKMASVLSRNVIAFAFPFGDYGQNNERFRNLADLSLANVRKNYSLALYQNRPGERFFANYQLPRNAGQKFFLIKRMDIDKDWTGKDIIDVMERAEAKSLPYRDDFSRDRGWVAAWGLSRVDTAGRALVVAPREAAVLGEGGAAILDGSRAWRNYALLATVNVPGRKSVYLWARFQDDLNNAACNFGHDFTHIEQTVSGERRVIKGVEGRPGQIPAGDFKVGVRVKDRTIQCLLNGRVVVETPFLEESLADGGIGFKIWDADKKQTTLYVKKLEVHAI